jgi:hypothetical protein
MDAGRIMENDIGVENESFCFTSVFHEPPSQSALKTSAEVVPGCSARSWGEVQITNSSIILLPLRYF